MRAFIGLLVAVSVVFSSCAPGLFGSESWGKSIFAPSAASDSAACDAGYQYGQTNKAIQTVGFIQFKSSKGPVRLLTRLGMAYFLCNSLGLLNGRKPASISPVFTTSISFDDASFVGKIAKVSISLEDQKGQEFARITAEQDETENSKQWYKLKSLSSGDIAALDKAVSFTIIIERAAGEEKYKITQQFQPYGPTVNAQAKVADLLSRHSLEIMSSGQK